MKNKKLEGVLAVSVFFSLLACKQNSYPGFTVTDDGLAYKIIKRSTDTLKPQNGDIMQMDVKYEAEDTVFYDSYKQGNPLTLQFPTAPYKGSIDEAFKKMCKGDSALIWTSADSFFVKVLKSEVPKKIKPNSKLLFTVTLKDLITKKELEERQKAEMAELEKLMKENKAKEPILIAEYIKVNKITEKARPSGLYLIKKTKGNGVKPQPGDMVQVHYVGRFLDGKVFDSSTKRGIPIDLQIGVGQVIKGWDEALLEMDEGSSYTLIIPSELAYGANGAQPVIPPYTPLVFEVTLLKVTKAK
jgi:FKBP-type peptidyl-prolyl cis-trans isomerase